MRLLLLRIGAMGDVLHALPAVAALRAALPAEHLAWAIDPRWQPLLRDSLGKTPLVDTIHPVETRLWKQHPLSRATLASIRSLRSALQSAHYDLAVDLQGSVRSAVIGRLAHSTRFVGPDSPREAPARLLYRQHVPTPATHVVDQAAQLLSGALNIDLQPSPVTLPTDPAAEAWWQQHPASNQPFIFLVPQAGWGAKQWPAERFGAASQQLAAAGYHVLVNQLHPADKLAATVVTTSGGTATAIATDLPQLIALTRRASLVLAGDTGPLHLAAALGRPVLALFGPTDPARTGPFGTTSRVLRHPSSVTDHSRHPATERGLLQITTQTVIDAAFDLLQPRPEEPRA